MPRDVLRVPIFYHGLLAFEQSDDSLRRQGDSPRQRSGVSDWWFGRSRLAAAFLYGTAREWYRLIFEDGLTISTNLFGTTYYSLVGLHGFHVIVGLILALRRYGIHVSGKCETRTRLSRRRVVLLLAFRGRGVGRGVHGRVHHRTLEHV